MKVKVLLINIIFLTKVRGTFFTSIFSMTKLIATQAEITKCLEDYLRTEKNRSKNVAVIFKYLKRAKEEHEIAMRDVEHYLGNPINAYTLIKRLTLELDYVESLIGDSKAYKRNTSVKYPTKEDLRGAVTGFLLIQVYYQLNTTQLSNGTLKGNYSRSKTPFVEHVTPMSSSDCYELGKANYSDANQERNIPWLMEALHKHNSNEYDVSTVTEYEIIFQIAYMYTIMSNEIESMVWIKKLMEKFHVMHHSDIKKIYVPMLQELMNLADSGDFTKRKDLPYIPVYDHRGGTVCRDEIIYSRALTCFYLRRRHPFMRLVRVKTEILYLTPLVLLIHDVISDSEIEVLQQMAKPKMERSLTDGIDKGHARVSRVSDGTWLDDESSFETDRLTRRVEYITGLSLESAEPMYVGNYGIGGHYISHHDYVKGSDDPRGNRLATVLLYLSEVEQGGATAFPLLGLTVFPIKGAALFWMNLLPTDRGLEGNWRTLHAACPVMRGNKWIVNRFIWEEGQRLPKKWFTSTGKK